MGSSPFRRGARIVSRGLGDLPGVYLEPIGDADALVWLEARDGTPSTLRSRPLADLAPQPGTVVDDATTARLRAYSDDLRAEGYTALHADLVAILDALASAQAEAVQVREALGLVPKATAEQVVYHIGCLQVDVREMTAERVDLLFRAQSKLDAARAEGLAKAADQIRVLGLLAATRARPFVSPRELADLADALDPRSTP